MLSVPLSEMGCGGSSPVQGTSSPYGSSQPPVSVPPSPRPGMEEGEGSDCSEHREAMPEEEVPTAGLPVTAAQAAKMTGCKWHAQIVQDDFFHKKLCSRPGELKPCRPMPHIKLSQLLERLVQNERGAWILSGELNGWPGLKDLELVSITCKVRSLVGTTSIGVRRLWLQGAESPSSDPVSVLSALKGKKLRSVRV
ncbi:unnamed protein product [Durusdinium trenchii]|uniref:Uncharacterized protein n=1 Tax=Durusdinium trenchii TaxID=1381693 RepID=A0ABP0SUX7_9DINO